MDDAQAEAVAEALGGETWDSGGGITLVVIRRGDGKVVAISDESVCEYEDADALEGGTPSASITLR